MGRQAFDMFGGWFKEALYYDPMAINPPAGLESVSLVDELLRAATW